MPPTTLTTRCHDALQNENVPTTAAVTAVLYSTRAEPSLTRLSPSMIATMRRGVPSPRRITSVEASASVGETIAPSVKAGAHAKPTAA
jgi:hypothetical protein